MHVLVIDDDRHFSHLLSAHLTRKGHEVTIAEDGIPGQRAARLHRPDVITIDYHMSAANGLVVAQRLGASSYTQNIPLIMLTGSPIDGMRERAFAAGVHDILSKLTLTEHELVRALEDAVEAHSAADDENHSLLFPGD